MAYDPTKIVSMPGIGFVPLGQIQSMIERDTHKLEKLATMMPSKSPTATSHGYSMATAEQAKLLARFNDILMHRTTLQRGKEAWILGR